jgi:anti-sigma regulatory factor (Ser/Thr protein kinase)
MDESIDLPCTAAQVATARRFVAGLLADSPREDHAVLLVSELATNAVRYSAARLGGRFTIRIQRKPGWARIEVSALGAEPWEPEFTVSDDDAESGRGLSIVFFLSDRMGHVWDGERDTVWAELDWEALDEAK